MTEIGFGADQRLVAGDGLALLTGIEQVIDFCLEAGDVFAVFDWRGEFCQLAIDADSDMHVESSLGDLVRHAGLTDSVAGFPWLWGSRLPASWHARSKMAAGAISRAFIEAGGMTFPAEVQVTVMKTPAAPAPKKPSAWIDGAPSVGFVFAEDRPLGWFAEGLAPLVGLDPATASIEDVQRRIHSRLENEYGPLNLERRHPIDADYVVELSYDNFSLQANRD